MYNSQVRDGQYAVVRKERKVKKGVWNPEFTIRDRFAEAALTGLLADGVRHYRIIAEYAYKYADSMLAERGK